jgi:hypothetical protein
MVEPETEALPRGDYAKLQAEVERIKARGKREPMLPPIPTESATAELARVKMETVTRICQDCRADFEAEILVSNGKRVGPIRCEACNAVFTSLARQEAEKEEKTRLVGKWEALCPALYRDTDLEKLGVASGIKETVLTWEPNPKGIGLSGESGAGKTRLMFLLLHRLHFSGVRCRAITAKRFENWCHRMFDKDDDARINIKSAHHIPVLFIDDIGKEKYTERVESEFYDLIEHRTSHLLPILWTANATGSQLERMMGEDRGVPIVRRLREFSTVISV